MVEEARTEELAVQGIVADIVLWQSEETFDIVILDRVLHLLADEEERRQVLDRSSKLTRPGGYVLVADTPQQQGLLQAFFTARSAEWTVTRQRRGLVFAHRVAGEASSPQRGSLMSR